MEDPSELFSKKENKIDTEMQTEMGATMGATMGNFGKTILKPTAMNSSLMPNVRKIDGNDTFREESLLKGEQSLG